MMECVYATQLPSYDFTISIAFTDKDSRESVIPMVNSSIATAKNELDSKNVVYSDEDAKQFGFLLRQVAYREEVLNKLFAGSGEDEWTAIRIGARTSSLKQWNAYHSSVWFRRGDYKIDLSFDAKTGFRKEDPHHWNLIRSLPLSDVSVHSIKARHLSKSSTWDSHLGITSSVGLPIPDGKHHVLQDKTIFLTKNMMRKLFSEIAKTFRENSYYWKKRNCNSLRVSLWYVLTGEWNTERMIELTIDRTAVNSGRFQRFRKSMREFFLKKQIYRLTKQTYRPDVKKDKKKVIAELETFYLLEEIEKMAYPKKAHEILTPKQMKSRAYLEMTLLRKTLNSLKSQSGLEIQLADNITSIKVLKENVAEAEKMIVNEFTSRNLKPGQRELLKMKDGMFYALASYKTEGERIMQRDRYQNSYSFAQNENLEDQIVADYREVGGECVVFVTGLQQAGYATQKFDQGNWEWATELCETCHHTGNGDCRPKPQDEKDQDSVDGCPSYCMPRQ
jgi:hypothetical protein